jgi:hypothetical protein
MHEGRDLAVTLIVSALLLLAVSSLTQCSAASQHSSTANNAAVGSAQGTSTGGEVQREKAAGPKSARELDEDQDEREKIQRVGHALQTIGANPELRKTLGIPQ